MLRPKGAELVAWFVDLMEEQGWTQTVAADRLGGVVDQTAVGKWVRAKRSGKPIPPPRGKTVGALTRLWDEVHARPLWPFKSLLVKAAVARAERPGAFHGFRGRVTIRDRIAYLYSYVLSEGGGAADLRELTEYAIQELSDHGDTGHDAGIQAALHSDSDAGS